MSRRNLREKDKPIYSLLRTIKKVTKFNKYQIKDHIYLQISSKQWRFIDTNPNIKYQNNTISGIQMVDDLGFDVLKAKLEKILVSVPIDLIRINIKRDKKILIGLLQRDDLKDEMRFKLEEILLVNI